MPRKLTTEQARDMAALRKHCRGGRPRSRKKRCPCGLMTARRARANRHRCVAQLPAILAPE